MTKKLWLKVVLIAGIFAMFFWSGLYYLQHSGAIVSSVEVKSVGSLHYVSKDALIGIIAPYQRLNWFYIDVHKVARAISAYPGIDQVKVEKYWPNKLVIEINEIKAIAYWETQSQLLLANRQIITPKEFIATESLPIFHGDVDQRQLIMDKYDQLNRLANSKNHVITAVYYQGNQWRIILDNSIEVILGAGDIENKLNRLLNNFSEITLSKGKKIAAVDLRYHTGFAVEVAQE